MPNCFSAILLWSPKRWIVAVVTAVLSGVLISLPTAIIENPVFGRDVAVTSWSIPVVILTAIISGLIVATYIRNDQSVEEERSIKIGGTGAFLSFLAVGCPVCNKIALVALGYSGALQYFAPVQPYLALFGVGLLMYALRQRLKGEVACSTGFLVGTVENKEK